jgi:F0F1-type ATP synthase assembly protein I
VAVVSRSPVESGSKRRLTATQQKGAAYQGALEAVFAILIAGGLGYWADWHFDSAPRYLVIGVVVGFGAFVLRLLRLGEQVKDLSEPAPGSEDADSGGGPGASDSGRARRQDRGVDLEDDVE